MVSIATESPGKTQPLVSYAAKHQQGTKSQYPNPLCRLYGSCALGDTDSNINLITVPKFHATNDVKDFLLIVKSRCHFAAL
jgi:hypothetical protein